MRLQQLLTYQGVVLRVTLFAAHTYLCACKRIYTHYSTPHPLNWQIWAISLCYIRALLHALSLCKILQLEKLFHWFCWSVRTGHFLKKSAKKLQFLQETRKEEGKEGLTFKDQIPQHRVPEIWAVPYLRWWAGWSEVGTWGAEGPGGQPAASHQSWELEGSCK